MRDLYENDEENGLSGDRAEHNLVLTPTNASVDDVIAALRNIEFYGRYISSIASNQMKLKKAMEDHFGPSVPALKKSLERKTGKLFAPKTKQAIDDFVKSYNPEPDLLKYSISGDKLVFPKKGNISSESTKNILKLVLGNAGIEYKIEEKENIGENLYDLRKTIKKLIREGLK